MTPRHYVLTLNGAAQQLSSVLPAADANPATPGVPASGTDRASRLYDSFHWISLQADGANGAAMFFGGDNGVTSSLWGFSLPAGAGGVPGPPFILGPMLVGKLKLENLWVIGTAAQVLHIFALEC